MALAQFFEKRQTELFNVNYISLPYCLTQKSYFLRQAAHPIDMFNDGVLREGRVLDVLTILLA
jgi:hypothetical protein